MASKNVSEVHEANWDSEVLKASGPVLVDFTATWCGPCKMLAPILDKVADEKAGKIKVVKLDIDRSPRIASQYGIRGVPTVMVFRDGQRAGQHVGLMNYDALVKFTGV